MFHDINGATAHPRSRVVVIDIGLSPFSDDAIGTWKPLSGRNAHDVSIT